MSSSQQEFLFFDTIAHDGEIEQVLQVDEIKFDQPVYIDEIRIIPSGYNVTGLEKSATRMGATKPMPCELEFFGKNLNARSNRDRVRYRRLGKRLFRDENDMIYYPSLSIPTDSMIVKGKYDTLTVAVVGVLARPKSPPPRHDPPSNNKQIVDFLQSALPHRAHPMDTLPLAVVPPANASSTPFGVQQHSHPSSIIDNVSPSSAAHSDGVWVAPPEQPTRQQPQVTGTFSHIQPQRPTSNFAGPPQTRLNGKINLKKCLSGSFIDSFFLDEHLHDYSHQSSQQSYPPNRLDDQQQQQQQQQLSSARSQPAPSFSSRPTARTNYSPSDYPHSDKPLDEIDEKYTRVPPNMTQYRPNIPDHITDDLSQLTNPIGVSLINPPFSHLSHQNPYSNSNNNKKDDDHLFLHPSCIGDNHRRVQDTYTMPSNNSNNIQQQMSSDGDSYMSDDNTSESEESSVHGVLFNEDEQQAFKRDALYNSRSSTRFTALKTFHSPIKTSYEIECEKAHHEKYRQANEELTLFFRKVLSHVTIDHCDTTFLESLESICTILPIALACLDSNEEKVSAIQRLTEWTLKLISIEYIMEKQFTELKDTLYKIRIIKCGIRLCGHLSVLTEDISNDWIKNDYQSKLLDLHDDEYIAPSVKLLIIKILDQSLFFKSGLLWFTGQHPDFPSITRESPYFRLIQKLQTGNELKQSTALINCLIRKIHLNEEFLSFQIQIKLLSSDDPSLSLDERKITLDQLNISLSTIRDVLINSTDLISQEKSSHIAPFQSILSVVFSKTSNYENSWPSVLRMMGDNDFFKSLTVLIHLCVLNQRQDIFNIIEDILREFLNSFDGLIYLANQKSTPNGLLKALYFAETKFVGINNDPVGPQLMCAFQTLSHIDELKFFSLKDDIELDDNDLLQVLHRLLSLILFHHYVRKLSTKRRIIVRVFAMETNFQPLLHFINFTGEGEAIKNSIQTRYIARIIYELFATSDSIYLLEQYGLRLYDLCEKHSNQRLVRLRNWFSPLLKIKSFDHTQETAINLINEVKTQLNESNNSGELSPNLITLLRIIQYLSIPPDNQFILGAKIELKYDYMLLKLYSNGIYSLLITILEKCADALLRTWQIGIPMVVHDRIVIYGILIPALIVFKTLLQKLTLDRKTKFVDITPIHALFSIYTVTLCASPSTELADVDIIRTNLIDSFLAYTWSNQSDNEQINVQNCAWTSVLREILRLTTLFPYSITSGLCLLTELLPIPLPLTVRQPLVENEINAIKDDFHRYHTVVHYIWTHDNNHCLQKLIQSLFHASNSIMQEILRRLCMQLIDLGPKLAKPIMKLLMDELISTWKTDHSETVKVSKQAIHDSARLVVFIASIIATRSGKCALLSLLNFSDEKYTTIIQDLLEYIHIRAESNETCLCQEAIMSIIQTLCDANICLSSPKSSDNSLQILANALPNQELLSNILIHILRLLSSTKHQQTWTQTTMGLRTMISLAEHDFGLEMIRIALTQNKEVFCTLIAEFDLRFDKEQPDYLEAVSALMVFLQRILTIETIPDSYFIRTQSLPVTFCRELLGVSLDNESQLEKFIDLINAVVNDDSSNTHDNENKQQTNDNADVLEQNEEDQQCLQTLQKIFERANSIIQSLKMTGNEQELLPKNEIILPRSELIDIQFQNRVVYTIVTDYIDDQRSSELYWFGIPPPSILDDVDYVQDETTTHPDETNDKVKCDLEDLIGKYCGTFDFFNEYKKEIIDKISKKRKTSPKKRTVTVEPPSHVDTSIITTSVSKGRTPWSAPMRGNNRRNVRPGNMNTNNAPPGGIRRTDHFRNRPLNTSRPPSMHVDEFEKQFNDNTNGNNGTNSSSSSNNNNNNINDNNNNNNGNNNTNENDMISSMQSSNDGGSDRERWSRRGNMPNFRINSSSSNHRYPFSSSNPGYPGGGFSLRDRLPYGYPSSSRYPTFETDFPPPYFVGDELADDRHYDYYPMSMPFDSVRYRPHFGRYDPNGFH
ncbi:unnamed protein product [Adineta steineri]|uniref:Virilizer N-terminal domain-containing protein n=2 Tax=Adineta steineri TaxID=433720 RepID=A0A819K087_9BILA|nr:unnamed protein product [Adineta steineri]